ncbi:MAG: SDR family NAD(P)-dependent oxidoreductase [Vicinamibacterales bacterium]
MTTIQPGSRARAPASCRRSPMNLNLTGKRALVSPPAAASATPPRSAWPARAPRSSSAAATRDGSRRRQKIREETGGTVEGLVADVSSADEAARLVQHAVATLGGLDIVVHNAGGPPAGEFLSMTDAQWQKAFDQNVMSFVRLVNAAVPEMKKAGGGRILTIASSSVKQPIPGLVLSNALGPACGGS